MPSHKQYFLAFVAGAVVAGAVFGFYAINKAPQRSTEAIVRDGQSGEPSAVVSPQEPARPKRPVKNLQMRWNDAPIKLDPAELGFTLNYRAQQEGAKLDDLYTVYHVGTVLGDTFGGSRFLLVGRWCEGPCGLSFYRVVEWNYGAKKPQFLVLKNISAELFPVDEGIFNMTEGYDISELHVPKELRIPFKEKELVFRAEPFSPDVLFEGFTSKRSLKVELTHPDYGKLYEDTEGGYFIIKLPDHTVKLYRLAFPFEGEEDRTSYRPGHELTLSYDNGESVVESFWFDNSYIPCPPIDYIVSEVQPAGLAARGTINEDGSFYEPRDTQSPLYRDFYEKVYFPGRTDVSYDEFVKSRPFIFWQDALGRWFQFTNIKDGPLAETECGHMNSVL